MRKPGVFITRRIPSEAMRQLDQVADVHLWDGDDAVPRDILLEEVSEATGLLCLLTEKIDEELLENAGQLKVVANMAVGFDNIDLNACGRRGVVVTNTPGVLTETSADFAFALLMAISRRVVEGDRYVREGKWKTWGPLLLLGQDLHHSVLGIIGLGRIGAEVAKRAQGFDMKILYHNNSRRDELERRYGLEYVDLDTLLGESDFVTLHVDLNPKTRHLLSAPQFRTMKRTSYLVNTARGAIVDLEALYHALLAGELAGAALDVTEPEPIAPNHPLLELPNVIVCPHIASASVDTRTRMATLAVDNLVAVLKNEKPPTPVDLHAAQR